MAALPDISIRQLEYLVAVAESGTWSEAAASVGVSASALSQGLAELERRIGVDLFAADGRRRVLRPVATPVLTHARRVVGLTGDLVAWADRMQHGSSGRLHVGMIDVAAVRHFPDVITRFRTAHPDVDFSLTVAQSSALLDLLANGELDVVVCVAAPETRPGLVTRHLMDEPLHVIAPPGIDPTDVVACGPWVLFPESSHTRVQIVSVLAALGVDVRIAAESHQPDVLLQMVRLGMGATVLPLDRPLDGGDVLVGPEVLQRQLVVAQRERAVVDPVVDLFVDAVHGAAM